MTDRHIATIETIKEIHPIPGADAIEVATVRNWKVVTSVGQFKPGDKCVYFEIDTFLPIEDSRFSHLASRGTKTNEAGITGHVLRTIKLRGQISQGMIAPLSEFPELSELTGDVTQVLGLDIWEEPLPESLGKISIGYNPSWIKSTSATRIQNILTEGLPKVGWQASEKIDGQNVNYFIDADEQTLRVSTRNLELSPPGDKVKHDQLSAPWKAAYESCAHQAIGELGVLGRVVIQGELAGVGIQGNPLKLTTTEFFAYRILVNDVDIHRDVWPAYLKQTPLIDGLEFGDPETMLNDANRKSLINPERNAEGIVWRYIGNEQCDEPLIKAISDTYLAKQK